MEDGILKKMPNDFVIDILSRLPVKLLLRFKCVSKFCYTLIESTTFINIHLNHATNNKEFIVVKRFTRESFYESKSFLSYFSIGDDDNDLHFVCTDKSTPYMTRNGPSNADRLLGTIHGLIVLTDKKHAVIFNPATRNYRLIKESPFGSLVGLHRYINGMGFGFDSIANEYKIVKLAELGGHPPFYCYTKKEWRLEVYELSTDSWREIEKLGQQFPSVHWCTCFELFYKGACHWFAHADTVVIVSLDMSTEVFRKMKMPSTCHFNDQKVYALIIMNESLTLICYPYPGDVEPTDFMEIWVIKEYGVSDSWSMKYKISAFVMKSPLAVYKDYLLFFQSLDAELISYNLNSDDVKQYNVQSWQDTLRVRVYKESLTLILKGSENIQQFKNFRED